MNERYFDNAATTPLDPRVLEAMLPFLTDQPGNPHSIHAWGIRARSAVETARAQVAALIAADDPTQIVFTSGATEGNNWLLRAFGAGWVSPFEHSSVREPAQALGYEVLENDGYEILPPARVTGRAEPNGGRVRCPLVSVMTVNNEIGTIFDAAALRVDGASVHSDATQAVGKIPFQVGELDFATFSAHKFYGPKGVGVLYARDPTSLEPMMLGGGHERGMRSGTLNVPGIVGAGAAAEIAGREMEADYVHADGLRREILDEVKDCARLQTLGGPKVSPYILSLSFADVQGESLVLELDALGFGVAAGAACSSQAVEPSHVLRALGISEEWLRGTIRVSFGRQNDLADAARLGRVLRESVDRLRKMRK